MPIHRFGALRLTLVTLGMAVLSLIAIPADARDGVRDRLDWWTAPAASKQLAQRICNTRYNPVCGTWHGRRRNFSNFCRARNAGATNLRRGRCSADTVCSSLVRPVCGFRLGRWTTYRNRCRARREGATGIRAGSCGTSARTCHRRATSRRYPHITGRSWNPACRATPARTCHRRATSRRYPHITGRSWNRACRAAPARTCHRRATSRRYPHITGRSWNRACRATPAPPAPPAPPAKRVGGPCVGKDSQGIPFNGHWAVEQRGGLNCLAGGGAR